MTSSHRDPILPRVLTVKEAAAALRVSTPTVYSLVKSGDLPAIQFSTRGGRGVVRVAVDDLKTFLDQHRGATR